MNLRPARVGVACAAALFSVTLVPDAVADPPTAFHDEFDEVADCGDGLLLDHHGEVDGRLHAVRRGDGLTYTSLYIDAVDTFTNPATGKTLIATNKGLAAKTQRIVPNGDGTVTVDSLSPARVAVRGPDGRLVASASGLVVYRELWHDAGTPGDNTDDVFLEFVGIVSQHGHVTGLEGCDLAHAYLT
jgi:hypothetical protein